LPSGYIREGNSPKASLYEFWFYSTNDNKGGTLAPRGVSTLLCMFMYKNI